LAQSQIRGLSDKDKEFLDALLKEGTLTKACKILGISISAGSRSKGKIVSMYLRSKEIIREVDYYRIRMASALGI